MACGTLLSDSAGSGGKTFLCRRWRDSLKNALSSVLRTVFTSASLQAQEALVLLSLQGHSAPISWLPLSLLLLHQVGGVGSPQEPGAFSPVGHSFSESPC